MVFFPENRQQVPTSQFSPTQSSGLVKRSRYYETQYYGFDFSTVQVQNGDFKTSITNFHRVKKTMKNSLDVKKLVIMTRLVFNCSKFTEKKKRGMAAELYLLFWFCFYAHDNYITLEKAKLVIIRNKI